MKRIISTLLAILLLFSTSMIAFADDEPIAGSDEPTFTVSSEEGHPGQNVIVTIRIDNNPGIASVKMKVQFDSDLTLNAITYNTELGGLSQQPETFGSPVTLNWFNGDGNTLGDMAYAVLDFSVAQNAAVGEHAIAITYNEDDVYCLNTENGTEQNVAFRIVNGSVNVTIPVAGISFAQTTATVATGDYTYTLTPIFDPANATNKNVSWESSDESVATVDGGVVTLLKKGEAVITATSEDGGFEASCTLTVLCSHLNCEDIPADPSTCIHQGHGAYTVCSDCGEIVSGSDALLPYADHVYIEDPQEKYLKSAANCASPAVYYKSCSVCEEAGEETFTYGEKDPDNHVGDTYTVNETIALATCEQDGSHYEVVHCSSCDAELSREEVIDPALEHSYGEPEWEWDGFDSAKAIISCIRGDDSHELIAEITSEVTKEPSASEDGERVYTAKVTFNDKEYLDTKTVVIPRQIIIGDADCDGEVTILDATAIQRFLVNLPNKAFDESAADADRDGDVTILDATAIQRFLASLPTSEYIGQYLT